MGKTATITLDGQQYTVRRFNIGELEEISQLGTNASGTIVTFRILELALRRAEPKVEDMRVLEPDSGEVGEAVRVILELAGMKPPENPPLAAAS